MIRMGDTFKRNIWCYFYARTAYVNNDAFTEFDGFDSELRHRGGSQ